MLIYSFHQSFKNIVSLAGKWKFNMFYYPLLKYVWLFSERLKVTKHFIFSSKGMLAQKLVTLASTILLHQWMEILPTQGICQEAPLAIRLHTNYSCPFCHTHFINREKVIEQIEICSGTYPEPEMMKLNGLNCQQAFEIYDKIENHIGFHIMR